MVAIPILSWKWDSRNVHLLWFLFSKSKAWALFAMNLASARIAELNNGQEHDILPSQWASLSWTTFIKEAENEDGKKDALDVDVQAVATAMKASGLAKPRKAEGVTEDQLVLKSPGNQNWPERR